MDITLTLPDNIGQLDFPDNLAGNPMAQNDALKQLLNTTLLNVDIYSIERMEKMTPPGRSGWRVWGL